MNLGWLGMYCKLTWDDWYKLAETYCAHHGNLQVRQNFSTINGYEYNQSGYKLGKWLNNQRTRYRTGLITQEQRKKLETLGFSFEKIEDFRWNKMYELAQKYYEHHRHLRIRQDFITSDGFTYDEKGYKLGIWLSNQRTKYKNGLLTEEQNKKLEKLGVNLENTHDFRWDKMYELTQKFYGHYGHLKIRQSFITSDGYTYDEKGYKLGIWLNDQRIAYNKGKLSQERIKKLEDVGIVLENVRGDNWNKMYELAQKFYEHHRHLRVPSKFKTKNGYERDAQGYNLGNWINHQRKLYAAKALSIQYIEKLKQIEMIFEDVVDKEWEKKYNLAKAYYEHYGHLRVKRSFKTKDGCTYDEDGFCLNTWITTQRMLCRKNKLSQEKILKLQLIGMLFVVRKNIDENITLCEQYGIDYIANKSIIDSISYRELISKINYLKSSNIPLTIDGILHPIFTMGNINMEVRYGINLETLLTQYSSSKNKQKKI